MRTPDNRVYVLLRSLTAPEVAALGGKLRKGSLGCRLLQAARHAAGATHEEVMGCLEGAAPGLAELETAKSRLKKMAVEVMAEGHSETDPVRAHALDMLHKARMLRHRGLAELSLDCLRALLRTLGTRTDPSLRLLALDDALRILKSYPALCSPLCMADIFRQRREAQEALAELDAVRQVADEAFGLSGRHFRGAGPQASGRAEELLRSPLLAPGRAMRTDEAAMRQEVARGFCARALGDRGAAMRSQLAQVGLWEADPQAILARPRAYQQAIIGVLDMMVALGQTEGYHALWQRAYAVPIPVPREHAMGLGLLMLSRGLMLMNTAGPARALEFMDEADILLAPLREHLTPGTVAALQCNRGEALWLAGQGERARKPLEAVRMAEARPDLQAAAAALLTLHALESGGLDYADHLSRWARQHCNDHPEVRSVWPALHPAAARMAAVPQGEWASVLRGFGQALKRLPGPMPAAAMACRQWAESRKLKFGRGEQKYESRNGELANERMRN